MKSRKRQQILAAFPAALLAATALWATIRIADSLRKRDWAAYGFLWGVILMANAAVLSLLPLFLGWAAYRNGKKTNLAVRHTALACGVILLCCVPWTIRNYLVFQNVVPLRSTLGLQLWVGNNPDAHVVWLGEDRHTAEQLLAEQGGADERDERDHVVAWVQDYLLDSAGFEAPYAQIQAAARQAGISERTLRNARRRAAVGYRRAGWQSGTVWVLDAEAAAELKAAREAEDPDAIEAIEASPVEAAPMAPMDGGKAD